MAIRANVCIKEADYTTTPYTSAVFEEQEVLGSAGTTLSFGNHTYQVMSDVWEDGKRAVYWDRFNRRLVTVDWAQAGTPDATKEVVNEIKNWWIDKEVNAAIAQAVEARKLISKGDTVRVTSGRFSKGSEGKVVVMMTARYGMGYYSSMETKLGIALDDTMKPVLGKNGKVYQNYANMIWVWQRNVTKITPDAPVTEQEIAEIRENKEGAFAYWFKGEFRNLAYLA